MARLLVTRPEPKASETAAALKARGHEAFAFPLTQLEALPHAPQIAAPNMLITSANALHFASPALRASLQGGQAFCVGAKTAQAAEQAGLHIAAIATSAADLAPQLPDTDFTYLCSAHRTPSLEQAIHRERLQIIETYHAPILTPENHEAPSHSHYDGVVFYSARSVQAWDQWLLTADHYFCLSHAIASELPNPAKKQAMVANHPDNAHLFTMIDKKFPPK